MQKVSYRTIHSIQTHFEMFRYLYTILADIPVHYYKVYIEYIACMCDCAYCWSNMHKLHFCKSRPVCLSAVRPLFWLNKSLF